MASLSEEKIRELMSKPLNIRNMTVMAHVDHGKTTLTDSLVQMAGIISQHKAGTQRYTDTREDEQDRCITIKSTAITMYYPVRLSDLKRYNLSTDGNEFLINLIDSPGHVDFSSEVTAALRVTDGAVVVVAINAGVCVQTRTVLRQGMAERIYPILFINKLDSCFAHQDTSEQIYQKIVRIIENINVIIHENLEDDSPLGDPRVDPLSGSVVFGSGLNCWAFRLRDVADLLTERTFAQKGLKADYSDEKFISASNTALRMLWGEHFYDEETKKISNKPGEKRTRTFCYFILDIIREVFMAGTDVQIIQSSIRRLKHDWELPQSAIGKEKNEIFRDSMKSFLPAGVSLLGAIVQHLPSPLVAQKYREPLLYTGDHSDPSAEAIRKCDPNGPVMIYVSKMVPSNEASRFFAMCRVFSGTISTATKICVMGPDYNPKTKKPLITNKFVKRVSILIGGKVINTASVPCGNICALAGVDDWLLRAGTLASDPEAFPIKTMKFSVSPIVQTLVWPKSSADMVKFSEGLKSLGKSDPVVTFKAVEDGKYLVSGTGELHLDICIQDLRTMYAKGVEILTGEPIVDYRETIEPQDMECYKSVTGKSSNNHNRLTMKALAMSENCMEALESGTIHTAMTAKERAKAVGLTGIADSVCGDIWRFAPEQACLSNFGLNFINNNTSSVQYLRECRDGIIKGFIEVACEGPLTGSELRGVIINLEDASFHSDTVHRNSAIISACSKRVSIGAMLSNRPRIVEPWFFAEVEHPRAHLNNVNQVINLRGGVVRETIERTHSAMTTHAVVPVRKSFDMLTHFRKQTGGEAFPSCSFSHWAIIDEDPYDSPIKTEHMVNAAQIVKEIRKRKNWNEKLPVAADYYDPILTKMQL